ncbi:amidohydrolase [bacterium]|nr:amidohydrolase [bacterium]
MGMSDAHENGNQRYFDAHLHVFPPRMFEAIWRWFDDLDWKVHRQTLDEILATLNAHNVIDAIVLSYAHKPGVARPLNDYMKMLGEQYPMLYPFGSVHPEDGDLDEYVREALDSPHIYGFKFQPMVQRYDVNDRRLDGFYAACQEHNFPITMHLGSAPYPCEFLGPEHFRRLMTRFPELRVCVAHMGGPEYSDFLAMLDDYPNVFMDTTMICTRTDLFDNRWHGDEQALRRHAHRVLYGSDWPNVPYGYQEVIDSVPRFPFTPGQLPGVYYDNVRRYLRLDAD